MPKLSNAKHELFARYLANGANQGDAYEKAGYARNNANASVLANRVDVATRVQELIEEKTKSSTAHHGERREKIKAGATLEEIGLTREWILGELMNLYEAAAAENQLKEAMALLRLLGHELGMFGGEAKPDPNEKKREAQQPAIAVDKMVALFSPPPPPEPLPAPTGEAGQAQQPSEPPKPSRPAADLSIDAMLGSFGEIGNLD